jgi:cobalt-zinc-cadmium efflux system protein
MMSTRTLAVSMALTVAFVVGEAIAGWFGHSLALLSDAGHNLTDAAALGLSWYAVSVARKPSHHGMTFGYHRVGVVAALVNAVSLIGIGAWIVWEALARLTAPENPNSGLMMGVALAAIIVNVVISRWLHEGSKHDLNIRSAYLHMLGDALSAGGVLVAGVVIAITGSVIADPAVSLLIAALILWSSFGVIRDCATILLEGTPPGTDMSAVIETLRGVPGVIGVHDLHVWMIGPGVVACSCHIVVAEKSVREGQQVVRAVVHEMEHRFRITHTTVQVEVEGCDPNDMYCGRPALVPPAHSH